MGGTHDVPFHVYPGPGLGGLVGATASIAMLYSYYPVTKLVPSKIPKGSLLFPLGGSDRLPCIRRFWRFAARTALLWFCRSLSDPVSSPFSSMYFA